MGTDLFVFDLPENVERAPAALHEAVAVPRLGVKRVHNSPQQQFKYTRFAKACIYIYVADLGLTANRSGREFNVDPLPDLRYNIYSPTA